MKWVALLLVIAAGAVGINTWAIGPDLSCPGVTAGGVLDYVAGAPFSPSADDALGDRLDDAAQVTEESSDANGFHTVTYRGYDTDGELMAIVVVEGPAQWRVASVDICE